MKPTVILAMVTSLNGKTTRWEEDTIHNWTSEEDRVFFSSLLEKQTAVIMGRKTYFLGRRAWERIPHPLYVVCTKKIDRYQSLTIPNQLEFTHETPASICENLAARGHQKILLAGGSELNTCFLEAGLIDELILTFEPRLFGHGKELFLPQYRMIDCKLVSVKQINKQGTLVLKYRLQKPALPHHS